MRRCLTLGTMLLAAPIVLLSNGAFGQEIGLENALALWFGRELPEQQ